MLLKHPYFMILHIWNLNRQYLRSYWQNTPNHLRGFLGKMLAFQTVHMTKLMLMLSRNSGKQQGLLWNVKYIQRWQITKFPAGLSQGSLIGTAWACDLPLITYTPHLLFVVQCVNFTIKANISLFSYCINKYVHMREETVQYFHCTGDGKKSNISINQLTICYSKQM